MAEPNSPDFSEPSVQIVLVFISKIFFIHKMPEIKTLDKGKHRLREDWMLKNRGVDFF